ncbi:MAG: DUF2891 domain-containing protein [Deltaproteobacteria bacterium]|nr:DUF2891 domain-containing protein [Deltaproteobacteria bacterium]MBK8239436.1 DUF2891 domain-containing protein [Deltaproteobacteria bacterium]MBK8719227.1 DUF2891 domain-containing protein [Deltaproteobacteria bacterium]MBP7287578.1 DUF2891 domain-containing protein [Nannocystaceae bacterium]
MGVDSEAPRYARLALECIDREYPNKPAHVITGDAQVRPPRELTPAFFGCFDWHSAVHAHWLLVRLLRRGWAGPHEAAARDALRRHLAPEPLAAEAAFVGAPAREGFERPYGLAWVLQLDADLARWSDPAAAGFAAALTPLRQLASTRLLRWAQALPRPVRTGEHSCSAFAFGLALDWARVRADPSFAAALGERVLALHGGDRRLPLHLEPSGQDFLSPSLATADLMRRVLDADAFAAWLRDALPGLDAEPTELPMPAVPGDRSDGKLVHADGLNLSRAWMLAAIARALPTGDRRIAALERGAHDHLRAGLDAVFASDYGGAHWLGSFAVYATSGDERDEGGPTLRADPPPG